MEEKKKKLKFSFLGKHCCFTLILHVDLIHIDWSLNPSRLVGKQKRCKDWSVKWFKLLIQFNTYIYAYFEGNASRFLSQDERCYLFEIIKYIYGCSLRLLALTSRLDSQNTLLNRGFQFQDEVAAINSGERLCEYFDYNTCSTDFVSGSVSWTDPFSNLFLQQLMQDM